MEEVSSLDSFGADSSARPESETSKLDEDNSTEKLDKQTDLQDTPASPPAEEEAGGVDADLATVSNVVEPTAADGDDDFEQISEGSLDVDESQSQEKQEAAASDEQDRVSKESEKAQTVPQADAEPEPEPAAEEEQEHYNIDNSADGESLQQRDAFENVEAADEGAAGDTDAVDGAPASMEAMDVDDAESEAQTEPSKGIGTEASTEVDDVEMRSEGGDSQHAVGEDNEDVHNTPETDKNAATRDEGIDEVDRSEEQDQDQDASASNENDGVNEDDDIENVDGEAEAEPMEDGADGETEQLDEGAEAEHGDGKHK